LAELGYVEGVNLTYIFDSTLIAGEALDTAAQNLVAANVDLIVTYGTAASLAAQRATVGTDIPVVFVGAVDPVQLGLVKSLQNTEGNVTGVGGVSEAYAKQLEWLMQIQPAIQTIYVPYPNLTNPVTAAPLQAIQEFAEKSGITVIAAPLPTPEEVTTALADLPDADAIMLVPFSPNPNGFIQAALERQIPLAYSFPNAMDLGPLLSYNYTEDGVGSTAARYADRILKGANPAELPVEIAPNSLAINLKTATALGLDISDEILLQAAILVR
jgi:putative ABC transport system substrate-binding protein